MNYRIFLVEDHPLMRRGYAHALNAEADLAVCGSAGTALEALEQIPAAAPDLVVVDLTLGAGPNGLELVKHLVARSPRLPILVVSMHEEALFAERALYAGARGYLMKTAAQELIVVAVRRILGGRLYLSAEVQRRLLHDMVGGYPERERSALASLTDRELEVFEHLGMGRTTEEIAEAMLIRPRTVDAYRTRIKERLGLQNSSQLVRCAVLWVERERLG